MEHNECVALSSHSLPNLTDKRIVITGANSGLGLASARQLAAHGAHVIMACRNMEKAATARDAIIADIPHASLEMRPLDLANLQSIRAFADEVVANRKPVDVLLNNAGVMATDYLRTTDGFEMQIGINHLGHFALTGLLLPALLESGGRIVNVSSMGHRPGKIHLDDLMFERRRYNRWSAYFQSKLANLLFTRELHRRLSTTLQPTVSLAAHPGTARTELGKVGTSLTNSMMNNLTGVLIRDARAGAVSQVRACVDDSLRGGEFVGPRWIAFGSPRLETPSRRARDDMAARHLWEVSENLTGVTFAI
jgi:NAD(P)-dependent dehydrogenase (short-subunit alcohol dehydrogenase family)